MVLNDDGSRDDLILHPVCLHSLLLSEHLQCQQE